VPDGHPVSSDDKNMPIPAARKMARLRQCIGEGFP
jgi:hypothetical protein